MNKLGNYDDPRHPMHALIDLETRLFMALKSGCLEDDWKQLIEKNINNARIDKRFDTYFSTQFKDDFIKYLENCKTDTKFIGNVLKLIQNKFLNGIIPTDMVPPQLQPQQRRKVQSRLNHQLQVINNLSQKEAFDMLKIYRTSINKGLEPEALKFLERKITSKIF